RLSDEEKSRLKEEEVQTKARGLVNRYLEIDYHLREVEKELARLDEAERKKAEALFFAYLCDAVSLEKDNDLIFQAVESLRQGKEKVVGKIADLTESFAERRESEYLAVEKTLLSSLEKKGISGSAVRPKVEGSAAWQAALAEFKPEYEKNLTELKKALAGSG
ncbi:MAG TPA: hypothetical protein VLS90_21120, partial [Thermodesulfobacteriota bacterium]|nr:hypothetical protein [Thermodesulfobacteriota bacterium]